MTSSTGFIVKTQVESANGAALRVERVTLSSNAQGLLTANSVGIQGAAATTTTPRSSSSQQPVAVTANRK